MKRKSRKKSWFLTSMVLLLVVGFTSLALAEEPKIVGYYYDPVTGKILPKYENMSPGEVEDFLGAQQPAVTGSNPGSPEEEASKGKDKDKTRGKSSEAPGQQKKK